MADGSTKLSGRDHEFQEPTLRRKQTVRREFQWKFSWRSGRVSTCRTKNDAEARKDFLSVQGEFIYRHHIEPRVQLHVQKKETFPVPLKYVDVTRSTFTDLDIAQEKRIDDCWNVDENRSLSDSWTGFTKFTLLKKTPPKGYMWSWERLTKIQTTTRPDHIWPEAWSRIGKAAQKRVKQEWALEQPKLENARSLRRIYSIDPSDEEFKVIVKNARRKLETPMAAAMPCKRTIAQASNWETVALKSGKSRSI